MPAFRVTTTGDELLASGELMLWRRVLLFKDGFETNDGTIGIGVSRGPFYNPSDFKTLAPEWYPSEFIVSTRVYELFSDGFDSGDATAWSAVVQ